MYNFTQIKEKLGKKLVNLQIIFINSAWLFAKWLFYLLSVDVKSVMLHSAIAAIFPLPQFVRLHFLFLFLYMGIFI